MQVIVGTSLYLQNSKIYFKLLKYYIIKQFCEKSNYMIFTFMLFFFQKPNYRILSFQLSPNAVKKVFVGLTTNCKIQFLNCNYRTHIQSHQFQMAFFTHEYLNASTNFQNQFGCIVVPMFYRSFVEFSLFCDTNKLDFPYLIRLYKNNYINTLD